MIFVVSVIVVFIAISVYFFFRAESLQRELLAIKREVKTTKKENKSLVDSTVLMMSRNDEFAKNRLQALKEKHSDNDEVLLKLELITPLINNYNNIASELVQGKGVLSKIVNKCYVGGDVNGYKDFTLFINREGDAIKRLWTSNDFKGFLSLVEMLLLAQEQMKDKQAKKD